MARVANVFCSRTRFGDLELQSRGDMPDAVSAPVTHADQPAALQLGRRKVDRDLDVVRPATASRRPPEDPFAEWNDQPGLFGDRDEIGRRDQSAGRMVPAQQGLERGDRRWSAGLTTG